MTSSEKKSRTPERSASGASPWSSLQGVREVSVSPGPRWTSLPRVQVPGSKSHTNRALILAALARGTSTISGILRSDDSYWCLEALRSLGTRVDVDDQTARVEGVDGRWPIRTSTVFTGSAGTVARFLPPAMCIDAGGCWTVDASAQMRARPMKSLFEVLAAQGAEIEFLGQDGALPVRLTSHGLRGGATTIPGDASSQFLSGFLIASPYAQSPVTVTVPGDIVQSSYVRLTLHSMARFGVRAEWEDGLRRIVVPTGRFVAQNLTLEPDVSTACYFMALAAITGQRIRIEGLSVETDQPDIGMLAVLERMGCRTTVDAGGVEVEGPTKLRGGWSVDMHAMSDQALTVAALAVFADAPISIHNVAHIRAHESDRLAVACENLQRLGVRVEEKPDGLVVHPGPVTPAILDPHDDHRVAMSLSLIGAAASGVRVANPGCVSKTFPGFFDRLASLGVTLAFT